MPATEAESGESLPMIHVSRTESNPSLQRRRESSMSTLILSTEAQLELWLQLCTCASTEFIDLCSSILDQLADGHREMTELLTLRHILDIDCIRRLNHDVEVLEMSHLSVALVMRVVEVLSVRLTDYHGPDSPRRREWQLRALISALTLLTYHKVTHLNDATLGKLHRACGQLTQDVYYAKRVASDELRDGTCMYLVRLVSDYIKFFKSDQPIGVTVFSRILNVAFAAGSVYQYNGRAAVLELDSAFRTLRASRQDKYKALVSLTELTRTIKIIYHWGLAESRPELDELAHQLAKLAVEHTVGILVNDPQLELQSKPNAFLRAGEILGANLARSSNLDQFSYMIGLLDNLAQIAQMFPVRSQNFLSRSLSPDYSLSIRLWELMGPSRAVQFHLKAIEIMLAFREERADNAQQLREQAKTLRSREQQEALIKHIYQVQKSLDDHDRDAGSSWLFLKPRLLPSAAQSPTLHMSQQRHPASTRSSSSPRPSTSHSQRGRSSSSATHPPSPSLTNVSTAGANPDKLPPMQFAPFDAKQSESFTYRYPFERSKLGFRRKNYFAVGISPSCDFVFFLGETYASIFRLSTENLTTSSLSLVLEIKAPNETVYRAAAIGDGVFAVITSDDCRIYSLEAGNRGVKEPQMVCLPITSEEWEPCSVGVSGGCSSSAIVALGWKAGLSLIRGQISLYSIPPASSGIISHTDYLEPFYTFNLCHGTQEKDLEEDYAKSISFSPDTKYLTATTQRFNIVYVWALKNIPTNTQWQGQPQEFTIYQICRTHREFSQEPGVEGVSSTTIFPSPFQNAGTPIPSRMSMGSSSTSSTSASQAPTHYILCTTSPSSERKHHQGLEYPFLSPLLSPFPLDDSPLFHCITAFVRDPHLQASAIPDSANVMAVLKRNGDIIIVPFLNVTGKLKTPSGSKGNAPADGLVKISAPKIKGKEKPKLKGNLVGREGALAWTRGVDGNPRLVAVDCEGLLVIVKFEGNNVTRKDVSRNFGGIGETGNGSLRGGRGENLGVGLGLGVPPVT